MREREGEERGAREREGGEGEREREGDESKKSLNEVRDILDTSKSGFTLLSFASPQPLTPPPPLTITTHIIIIAHHQ